MLFLNKYFKFSIKSFSMHMQQFKYFLVFTSLFYFGFGLIYAAEENNTVLRQWAQIDEDEEEILQMLSEEKGRIEAIEAEKRRKIKEKYQQRVAEAKRLAEIKQRAEEERRNREEKVKMTRLKIERQKLDEICHEQKELRLRRIAEVQRAKNSRITAHIDLSQQRMKVFKGDDLLYKWRVSTARKGYVTPVGNYQPQFLERIHYSKLYHNSPMPHSIFFKGNFAIHGTNSIWRLGRQASHGCVRLHPKNAKRLYALIRKYGKKNTFINIVY